MREQLGFPSQALSYSKKNKEWRKRCVRWGRDNGSMLNHSLVRKTVEAKRSNYDLVNGKINPRDIARHVNPYGLQASFISDDIQHYPILNAKLNVLRGEESRRLFDYRVIVTNPNTISEIEENKKAEIMNKLMSLIANEGLTEEQYKQEIEKLQKHYKYSWQDLRELRGNYLLNHYSKEYNLSLLFNEGFMDALICGEEIYKCDIVGGEPVIERLNPLKVRVFKSGYSRRIEDADIIVVEDYWQPSRVIDTYHEVLTPKDVRTIDEGLWVNGSSGESNFEDSRRGFLSTAHLDIGSEAGDAFYTSYFGDDGISGNSGPVDADGNVRVLNVYWKSRRKVKKVTRVNPQTGDIEEDIYPETYVIDPFSGETEKVMWINEAWEGTLIGDDIFVNMRPRRVQYNRLSNPSYCHLGIIGSIYNLNESKPFSLVDIMKPYNMMYNVIHDRLNKLMANNLGKIITMDLAKIPKGWEIDKWLHYIRTNGIAVVDSFKEGNYGAATGKLAGGLNNNTSGVIDAELGQSIASNIQLLEFIKNEMSEAVGISRQREGQIFNRETVGGVERSNLQSSHITEYVFLIHEDTKRRALECFLETAKLSLRGNTKKFQYILPDSSKEIMEIDGEEFAEADYGLVVDNSQNSQDLYNKIDMLAQAALQNQTLNFSTIMQLYSSASLAEKWKIVEENEAQMAQRAQEAQQMQQQQFQANLQAQQQRYQEELQFKDMINQRDNNTKIEVARMQAENAMNQMVFRLDDDQFSEEEQKDLERKEKEFSEKMRHEKEKLELEKKKHKENIKVKMEAIKQSAKNNKK